MKVLVYSDLHLEAADFRPDPELLEEADLVILAGDIANGVEGVRWAAQTFPPHLAVLYVPGNHEFYGEHRVSMLHTIWWAALKTINVTVLDNAAVNYFGVSFLGATLWTDYELFVPEDADKHAREIDRVTSMNECRRALNDHKLIYERLNAKGKTAKAGLVQPYDLLALHEQSRDWLHATLTERRDKRHWGPKVVITHHAPAAQSLGRWYEKPTSPAYASRLPADLMGAADLWIHGHIHDPVDYMHHDCRVISNPRGYPDRKSLLLGEEPVFDNRGFADLLLDIDPAKPSAEWVKRSSQPRPRTMSSSWG